MESKTAFVGTESGIVLMCELIEFDSSETDGVLLSYLNTESAINLRDTVIIFPYDTELQDTLWDLYNLKCLLIIWVTFQEMSQTSLQLFESLQRGRNVRITGNR